MAPSANQQYREYQAWLRQRAPGQEHCAVKMYRYADDFILLIRGTEDQARAIKEECRAFLRDELGLELSDEKTTITHVRDGFDFLGFDVIRNETPKDHRKVGTYILPTARSQQRVRRKIHDMTDSNDTNDDYLYKLQAVNAVVRGWANYYRAVNSYATLSALDSYVWNRLRRWLQKKHRVGAQQVRRRFMHPKPGATKTIREFAAPDAKGHWVWRYRATSTKLIHYRPTFKLNWPHPYLETVQVQHFELPALKTMWTGNSEAPTYAANRREVLRQANGNCQRCGQAAELAGHHIKRAKRTKRSAEHADNRPEMLEALCRDCHAQEHRAEVIYRNKARKASRTGSTMGESPVQ
jgi:RNA-directed DNA polymerase